MMEKKLWFRRKAYGRGWTPCTWEGWITLLLFLLGIYSVTRTLQQAGMPSLYMMLASYLTLAVLLIFLFIICYARGEEPKRQWGRKSIKN